MSEARWDEFPYTMDDYYKEMDVVNVKEAKAVIASSLSKTNSPIKERLKEVLNIILGRK